MQIPAQIDRYLTGWERRLVWESGPATLTWLMTGPGGEQRYLKTAPADAAVPLRAEAARMRWAGAAGLPVPPVLAACAAGPAEWLLTRGLAGRSAVDPGLRADPERLVPLLAAGLRRFHQAPAGDCPFRFEAELALERVRKRVRAGVVKPDDMHPEHAHLTPAQALAELERWRWAAGA